MKKEIVRFKLIKWLKGVTFCMIENIRSQKEKKI